MCNDIAHGAHFCPREIGVTLLDCFGDVSNSLTDNFQIS
jgi:hypothetical protein